MIDIISSFLSFGVTRLPTSNLLVEYYTRLFLSINGHIIPAVENLTLEEQSELLVERFEEGVKVGFGAILILHSIYRHRKASSKELRKDLKEIFPESTEYNYTSFYRLLGRLKDEFKLIIETERRKAKGPERVYYSLTPLGKLTLTKVFERYIEPLGKLKL